MRIDTIKQYYNHVIRKMIAEIENIENAYQEGLLPDKTEKDLLQEVFNIKQRCKERTEEFVNSFSKKRQPKIRQEINEYYQAIEMPLKIA